MKPEDLYLDLMKRCLTRLAFPERYRALDPPPGAKRALVTTVRRALALLGLDLVRPARVDVETRRAGRDLPPEAETMIGLVRLDHLQRCVETVIKDGGPGDLIEAGVWRGGAAILMRAALLAHGDEGRLVFVADSFRGLPPPDPRRFPEEARTRRPDLERFLSVPLEEVRANFARYGLLDERVRFLPGFFHETLPQAPPGPLALVRLDGDLYESTAVVLQHLYPRLSTGGFLIVDDYGETAGCRAAVEEYRKRQGISAALQSVDRGCVFWRKE